MSRIVLFALTGFGNPVLRSLVSSGHTPSLLVTRGESGPYPYFACENIGEEAERCGIPVEVGEAGERRARDLKADLLLAATYHRRLGQELLSTARWAINLHPSLLPAYPGRNPFFAALWNGELRTGVTAHVITDRLDAGDVILQRKVDIARDETQGTLRHRLAELAGELVPYLLDQLATGTLFARPQQIEPIPSVPNLEESMRVLTSQNTVEHLDRQVRSLSPWPGALVPALGVTVNGVAAVQRGITSENPPTIIEKVVTMPASNGQLLLNVAAGQGTSI